MQWDRTSLLSSVGSANPVDFTSPGGAKSADIVVHDTQIYQPIYGFGGSLSTCFSHESMPNTHGLTADSAALTLNNLKVFYIAGYRGQCLITGEQNRNSNNYWNLLRYLFDPTDGANAAGLSYVRVPLGASDFSAGREFARILSETYN